MTSICWSVLLHIFVTDNFYSVFIIFSQNIYPNYKNVCFCSNLSEVVFCTVHISRIYYNAHWLQISIFASIYISTILDNNHHVITCVIFHEFDIWRRWENVAIRTHIRSGFCCIFIWFSSWSSLWIVLSYHQSWLVYNWLSLSFVG